MRRLRVGVGGGGDREVGMTRRGFSSVDAGRKIREGGANVFLRCLCWRGKELRFVGWRRLARFVCLGLEVRFLRLRNGLGGGGRPNRNGGWKIGEFAGGVDFWRSAGLGKL